MVVEASITGLFRTVLIIVGAIVIVRFIGQLMNAKRNMEEERQMNKKQRSFEAEKKRKRMNMGKTEVLKKNSGHADAEDVDFEEVKD